MLQQLENKRQQIEDSCIKNIDNVLTLDIRNARSDFSADVQNTNTILVHKLKKKYPWSDFHVFTMAGDDKPKIWSTESARRHFRSSSNALKIHAFVVPTNNAPVQDLEHKVQEWTQVLLRIEFSGTLDKQIENIEQELKNNPVLDGQIQSFAILKGTKWALGYYDNEIKQHTLGTYNVSNMNIFVNRPHQSKGFLVAVSFLPNNYPFSCSESQNCNGRGQCYTYPYSRLTSCKCTTGYGGDDCQNSRTDLQLQSIMDSLLNNTLKLPTFASIRHTLQDVHMSLKASSENIKGSIAYLEAKVDDTLTSMGEFMSEKFKWFNIQMRYIDAIESVPYFHKIFGTNNTHQVSECSNNTFNNIITNVSMDESSSIEERQISEFLLNPTGIQLWMYQINYLIVGRRDSQFNSHESLVFMVMDKYKDLLCTQDYKDAVTRMYRQLMLLQFRGFMLWSKAYTTASMDSSALAGRYQDVLRQQQEYFQQATCAINISHSKNLRNCVGPGFLNYIHKSLDVQAACQDGYFLKGICAIIVLISLYRLNKLFQFIRV